MNVEKLVLLAVIAAVLIILLKNSRPEQGMILSIISACLLFLYILDDLVPLLSELQKLWQRLPLSSSSWELLLKILGICLLVQTGEELCRDAGVSSLATKIELAGKITVLLLCLPLIQQLLDLTARLIG